MKRFEVLEGPAAALLRANIDTDTIIPMRRLLLTAADEMGPFAFEPLRYRADGSEEPEFPFNRPGFREAPILLAGPNFGCGSSREAAVWALRGMGLRCVIAPGFGDIFRSNCFQNGVLAIQLPAETVEALAAEAADGAAFRVDLRACTVRGPTGREVGFSVPALRREALLEGLDDIGLTLKRADEIEAFQARDRAARPWIWRFGSAG